MLVIFKLCGINKPIAHFHLTNLRTSDIWLMEIGLKKMLMKNKMPTHISHEERLLG